jgi:hypothetical protein
MYSSASYSPDSKGSKSSSFLVGKGHHNNSELFSDMLLKNSSTEKADKLIEGP